MRPLLGRLLAGLLALLPLTAVADPFGYAAGFSDLYRIDLATGQATRVGPIGFNDVDGLAFGPDGTLFGVADATAGSGSAVSDLLVRISTVTGLGTLVAPLSGLSGTGPGGSLDYGLAFTCDGRLWMSSDSTGQFWEVAPSTAQVRLVGNTGAPLSGLAARGNVVFGVGVRRGFDDPAQQSTYSIDVSNAIATRIGSLGIADTLSGAGADFDASGTLWATLDSQPPDFNRASRIARIDVSSGAATVTGSVIGIQDNISARALAIAATGGCGAVVNATPLPVPGPGVPMLALLGAITAAFGVRRLASV